MSANSPACVLHSPASGSNSSSTPVKKFRFSSENARFFQAKARISRLANVQAREEPKPEPRQSDPVHSPVAIQTLKDPYTDERLKRVRKQLDQLDVAIQREVEAKNPNGQRLNWLCAAQERLSEQERQLAGRPLPGSFRPTSKISNAGMIEAPLQQPSQAPAGPQQEEQE